MSRRSSGRSHCLICGEPCTSLICKLVACAEELKRIRHGIKAGLKIDVQLAQMRRNWPPEWTRTQPFADNVRVCARGSIGLPTLSLEGGCSSSSGWIVNLQEG